MQYKERKNIFRGTIGRLSFEYYETHNVGR